MIESCESCGENFLTEADPYVVRPTSKGYKLYCCCHIKGFDEVKSMKDKIEAENKKLREALSLIEMANCYTDYEDAVSIAREALEEVGDK
jgi:hypothetical protein